MNKLTSENTLKWELRCIIQNHLGKIHVFVLAVYKIEEKNRHEKRGTHLSVS